MLFWIVSVRQKLEESQKRIPADQPPMKSGLYFVMAKDEYLDGKARAYNQPVDPAPIPAIAEFDIDRKSWLVHGLSGYAEVVEWSELT